MRSLFFLLQLSLFVNFTLAQTCTDPDGIASNYREDAEKRALYITNLTKSKYKDSIQLNKALADSIHYAIVSAYYSDKTSANHDTIFNLLDIHNLTTVSVVRYLSIAADTSYLWAKNFYKYFYPTGNKNFDSLIVKYQLTPNTQVPFPEGILGDRFIFEVALGYSVNVKNAAKEFLAISGVVDAAEGGVYQMEIGNKIEYENFKTHQNIIFSIGWGDCPSNCTRWRHWRYRIGKNCVAILDSIYGLNLDYEILHNLQNKLQKENKVLLYPNPAKEKLFISGLNNEFHYLIYNLSGIKIISGTYHNEIDIRNLAAGNYILRLDNGNWNKRIMFTKTN